MRSLTVAQNMLPNDRAPEGARIQEQLRRPHPHPVKPEDQKNCRFEPPPPPQHAKAPSRKAIANHYEAGLLLPPHLLEKQTLPANQHGCVSDGMYPISWGTVARRLSSREKT